MNASLAIVIRKWRVLIEKDAKGSTSHRSCERDDEAARRLADSARRCRGYPARFARAAVRSRRHCDRRGNLSHHDDVSRAARLNESGIRYVDLGANGGVWDVERGDRQMIGGERRPLRRS